MDKINRRLTVLEMNRFKNLNKEGNTLIEKLDNRLWGVLTLEERKLLGKYILQTLSCEIFISQSGSPKLDGIVSKTRSDPKASEAIDEFISFIQKCENVTVKDPSWLKT